MGTISFCDNNFTMLDNFRGDIIEHFHSKGHSIVLIYPKTTSSPFLINKYSYAKHYPLDVNPSAISPLNDVAFLYRLLRIYRCEKPDIAFHYTIKPNIYGSIASRLVGIKSCAMVAGLGYMFSGKGLSKTIGPLLYKIGLHTSSIVLCLNEANYNLLISRNFVSAARLMLISAGEGVNLVKYPYKSKTFTEPLRFLMVARVLYDKGYREFVEAARIVKQSYPNVDFSLIGPLAPDSPMGVPESELKKDVSDGWVNYWGVTNEIQKVLSYDSVVVVLSSYHEGLNRALIEACAMGCPCITSNIPGCQEIVDNNQNGFLAPPKNGNALAAAIFNFIDLSKSDKIKMSEKSYMKALRQFNIEDVKSQYDQIYHRLTTDI